MPRRFSYKTGLPESVATKIYKTGQTRGADNDEIFQNRVLRSNTALIPIGVWGRLSSVEFENGYTVYARPEQYFSDSPPNPKSELPNGLTLGENLIVYYRTRAEWRKYNPERYGWDFATSREAPMGGQYIARVPDTTSADHNRIFRGFTGSGSGGKGAGIRVYEYAGTEMLRRTRYQLAYLAWHTVGMLEMSSDLGEEEPEVCKQYVEEYCQERGLADPERLEENRLVEGSNTVCPLCLKPMKAEELTSKVEQAEGRSVPDLTVTSANLFHVEELTHGIFNHKVYNLGWGHHHCNTVIRDFGVRPTLQWMADVLRENSFEVIGPSGRV